MITVMFMLVYSTVPNWEGYDTADVNAVCPTVNVTLWEGNVTQRLLNPYSVRYGGRYCGQEPPSAFIGRGAITITYNYLALFESFGFRAQYSIYRKEITLNFIINLIGIRKNAWQCLFPIFNETLKI